MAVKTSTQNALHTLAVTTKPSSLKSFPTLRSLQNPLLFSRLGKGLLGRGASVRAEFSGPERFADAHAWWRNLCERAKVTDEVRRPGTGLVAFGAFTFAHSSAQTSVLIVPEKIIGIDESGAFETSIDVLSGSHDTELLPAPEHKRFGFKSGWVAAEVSSDRFVSLVTRTKKEIQSGLLHKAVIARDLTRAIPKEFSPEGVLARLTEAYPDTLVFSVDGLVGASPEKLASVRGRHVSLRVLAGSSARGTNEEDDVEKARALATSQKDLDEHQFAVQNVIHTLQSYDVRAVADDTPFQLKLPNLWHLATDVRAVLPKSYSCLQVIEALHPTAAVAGSPTADALRFIESHEGLDRGRYAGPVGWVDARGDGDWAIALRCAQIDPGSHTITAYAGAGIVAESDPAKELLETELKFQPIIDAVNQELR